MDTLSFPAGDAQLIERIVNEFLSQGKFDKLRKECMADVDTKPAYQNLQQRVEAQVSSFLHKQKWKPDLIKNQLRDSLRKYVLDSPLLDSGIDRIVDQVVNPKMLATIFLPQVEEVVYNFLGLPVPSKQAKPKQITSLLDLKFDDMMFKPPDILKNSTIDPPGVSGIQSVPVNIFPEPFKTESCTEGTEEAEKDPISSRASNDNDSQLSGISELTSHCSNPSVFPDDSDRGGTPDLPFKEAITDPETTDQSFPMEGTTPPRIKMEVMFEESQESVRQLDLASMTLDIKDPEMIEDEQPNQLLFDEKYNSDYESGDSIRIKMSPISVGDPQSDTEFNEIKPVVKKEEIMNSPKVDSPKKPSRRIYSSDESDIGKDPQNVVEVKVKVEENVETKKKDEKRSDSKRRDRSKDRHRRRDDKRDEKKNDKTPEKAKRDDKSRSSSHHKSSRSDHHSKSHRDSSKSKDKSSSHSRSKESSKSSSKGRSGDDKDKKRDKKKTVDDHNSEKNKKEERRSTDRDSHEGDKSSNGRGQSELHKNEKERSDSKRKDRREKEPSKNENLGKKKTTDNHKEKKEDRRSTDSDSHEKDKSSHSRSNSELNKNEKERYSSKRKDRRGKDSNEDKKKPADDHGCEKNKLEERRSTDRDSHEGDKSNSRSHSVSNKNEKERSDGKSRDRREREQRKDKKHENKDSSLRDKEGSSRSRSYHERKYSDSHRKHDYYKSDKNRGSRSYKERESRNDTSKQTKEELHVEIKSDKSKIDLTLVETLVEDKSKIDLTLVETLVEDKSKIDLNLVETLVEDKSKIDLTVVETLVEESKRPLKSDQLSSLSENSTVHLVNEKESTGKVEVHTDNIKNTDTTASEESDQKITDVEDINHSKSISIIKKELIEEEHPEKLNEECSDEKDAVCCKDSSSVKLVIKLEPVDDIEESSLQNEECYNQQTEVHVEVEQAGAENKEHKNAHEEQAKAEIREQEIKECPRNYVQLCLEKKYKKHCFSNSLGTNTTFQYFDAPSELSNETLFTNWVDGIEQNIDSLALSDDEADTDIIDSFFDFNRKIFECIENAESNFEGGLVLDPKTNSFYSKIEQPKVAVNPAGFVECIDISSSTNSSYFLPTNLSIAEINDIIGCNPTATGDEDDNSSCDSYQSETEVTKNKVAEKMVESYPVVKIKKEIIEVEDVVENEGLQKELKNQVTHVNGKLSDVETELVENVCLRNRRGAPKKQITSRVAESNQELNFKMANGKKRKQPTSHSKVNIKKSCPPSVDHSSFSFPPSPDTDDSVAMEEGHPAAITVLAEIPATLAKTGNVRKRLRSCAKGNADYENTPKDKKKQKYDNLDLYKPRLSFSSTSRRNKAV